METTSLIQHQPPPSGMPLVAEGPTPTPFSQEMLTISKQEHIGLIQQISYWQAQHARAQKKIKQLEQENLHKDGKIKDLQNRLFGKRSEKNSSASLNTSSSINGSSHKNTQKKTRGQQPNCKGHGRTTRPDLPVIEEKLDLPDDKKHCPICGLHHTANPESPEKSPFWPKGQFFA